MEDDGEEEEGSVAAGVEEDSSSEGSAISDADDDADAEGSDGDDTGSPTQDLSKAVVVNGHPEKSKDFEALSGTTRAKSPLMMAIGDTEAMMNGLKVAGNEEEGVAFEDIGKETEIQLPSDIQRGEVESGDADNFGDKRRREHEEYRNKRDSDPAFVPNRGGFFMHDHRSAAAGQNSFRPFGRGRGRGRGGLRGPLVPSRYASNSRIDFLDHTLLTIK